MAKQSIRHAPRRHERQSIRDGAVEVRDRVSRFRRSSFGKAGAHMRWRMSPVRLQRWAGAFAAALGMTATARAQPPAAHDSSNVGVATPCRNPVERWAGAFDFVSQSLSAVDSANISASELLRLDQRIGEAAREALGGSDALIPRADTLGALGDDGAVPLTIVLHRDAPATWHPAPSTDSADARLATFYRVVLGSMAPNDQRTPWPTGATSDSAIIRVWMSTQQFGRLMNAGIAWRVVMEATIDADGNLKRNTIQAPRCTTANSSPPRVRPSSPARFTRLASAVAQCASAYGNHSRSAFAHDQETMRAIRVMRGAVVFLGRAPSMCARNGARSTTDLTTSPRRPGSWPNGRNRVTLCGGGDAKGGTRTPTDCSTGS